MFLLLRQKVAHRLFVAFMSLVNHRSSLTDKNILINSPVFDIWDYGECYRHVSSKRNARATHLKTNDLLEDHELIGPPASTSCIPRKPSTYKQNILRFSALNSFCCSTSTKIRESGSPLSIRRVRSFVLILIYNSEKLVSF